MPDISSIGYGSIDPLSRPGAVSAFHRNGTVSQTEPVSRDIDRVELSDHARFLDKIIRLPGGRSEIVEQIRQSIDSGEYETEEKLSVAISNLINDIKN